MDYPMPSHACMMWVAGETLYVRFPPEPGHDTGHMVTFESDLQGLTSLISVMRARAKHKAQLKVGHPGTPTQYDVQRLRAMAQGLKTTRIEPKLSKKEARQRELAALIADLEL